jgi:hypothetical protein
LPTGPVERLPEEVLGNGRGSGCALRPQQLALDAQQLRHQPPFVGPLGAGDHLLDPKVTSLVYVAARAPDAGEDYAALAARFPTPPANAGVVWSGDYAQLSEAAFLHDFAGDLPAAKARVLYAVQSPFQRTLLAGKTTHAAWRSKPSWYAVSTEDRTINPDLERFMAKRMGATTIEVRASHLSLISQPDTITRLILDTAGQA